MSKILFGGFGRGGRHKGGKMWKHKMKRRWMNMSPEQRDSYMSSYSQYCRYPAQPAGSEELQKSE